MVDDRAQRLLSHQHPPLIGEHVVKLGKTMPLLAVASPTVPTIDNESTTMTTAKSLVDCSSWGKYLLVTSLT
jgi:hypothetical protein